MIQLSLIPQTIVKWYPPKATASKPRIAQATDGLDYAVKHDEANVPVRANEWVCANLARAVGIPIPAFTIVDDGQGEMLFASQVYGHDMNDNKPIFMGNLPNQEIIKQISRIYAFDLFVHNVDRHVNNYLIREQNKKERIFAFDHGWSLFNYWPHINLPFRPDRKTLRTIRLIIRHWGFDLPATNEVLNSFRNISDSDIQATVNGMPGSWLDKKIRGEFLSWWFKHSGARADEITKGLGNGQLL